MVMQVCTYLRPDIIITVIALLSDIQLASLNNTQYDYCSHMSMSVLVGSYISALK